MENQHKVPTPKKINWETPVIQSIAINLIKQQEEEELMRLLADENNFRLLTGSV